MTIVLVAGCRLDEELRVYDGNERNLLE